MSEKKNEYNEIIYLLPKFQKIVDNWYRSVEFASNAKLDDNQVAYILKQTHDKEVAELKAEIERLKGTDEYVCPNQCDWIGMFGGELCDECKKREQ